MSLVSDLVPVTSLLHTSEQGVTLEWDTKSQAPSSSDSTQDWEYCRSPQIAKFGPGTNLSLSVVGEIMYRLWVPYFLLRYKTLQINQPLYKWLVNMFNSKSLKVKGRDKCQFTERTSYLGVV